MMRKPIVAGNWKMNGSGQANQVLMETISSNSINSEELDIIVFPSYVYLYQAIDILKNTNINIGAQNISEHTKGAFTGEVSGLMLKDMGCEYVLVGHSERRQYYHEDSHLVAKKFITAVDAGLKPILCVGETESEQENNQTEQVIASQLDSLLKNQPDYLKKGLIAYEPVWAIGTGKSATPDHAQAIHAFIRTHLAKYDDLLADQTQILYGGSIKADNAADLFSMSDIDGGLVGGASLDADAFMTICQAAI